MPVEASPSSLPIDHSDDRNSGPSETKYPEVATCQCPKGDQSEPEYHRIDTPRRRHPSNYCSGSADAYQATLASTGTEYKCYYRKETGNRIGDQEGIPRHRRGSTSCGEIKEEANQRICHHVHG